MILKGAIALLVAGLVCFAVYSFTSKPDYSLVYEMEQGELHAKVLSSEIYPKKAYTNNSLRIKMAKAKKEEYQYIAVAWYRNGQKIHNYNDPTLIPSKFRKGDRIHAEVNLLGPEEMDEPVVTHAVTVLNTPPQIIEASAVMQQIPSDVITARVNAVDADADHIRYRYIWFINDQEVPSQSKATLNVKECQNGDEVYAQIVAMDGEDESPPHKSEPLRIGSNVLEITSQPPQSVGEDRRFEYQVSATGPDPESMVYQLITGPEGMSISKTGKVEWKMPTPKLGETAYEVVVRVSDATGGEAFQEFAINVTGKRRLSAQ
jgi:hypothetical protein